MPDVNIDALAEAYWAWRDPEFWDDEEPEEDSDIDKEEEDE